MFSFACCHGECGSRKYAGTPVATVNFAGAAISTPWSQANEPRRSSGSFSTSADRLVASRSAVRPQEASGAAVAPSGLGWAR
jgi:hypothetical protein